ncbi:MAG TPA: hypothetical protein VLZ74_12080 [Methylocella sp.]|nr:hypothetical protein [Methylocella sp.]
MAAQQIYVLGSDGNLWLEQGPFSGEQIPPPRVPVDGNVDLDAAFQAFYSNEVLVCGSDGNLWLEEGPFGTVPLPNSSYPPAPRSRYQIDGNAAAFFAWSPGDIFVLGTDGNLWLEFGFGTTLPTVPPPRTQIDGSVVEFQPMSLQEVFVLGQDGNLWHELGPFGTVPLPPCNGGTAGCRSQVDANVRDFMAVDSEHVYVVDNNNNLWLEQGPFGRQIPPSHIPVDGNVAGIWAVDSEEIYVLGTDGNLWLENAPFGVVPLPPCSQTSGFGKGFGCRTLIYSNVAAFGVFPDAGGIFVTDGNLDLWQLGTPNVQIDGNVIDFQPLSTEQMLARAESHSKPGASSTRPVRPTGIKRPSRPRKRA